MTQFESLKREILSLGFVRPGSLVRRYMPCGKPTCSCMEDGQQHGPYWQWSHKVKGKTRTMRLTEEQALLCREWTANHKRLKQIVRELEKISLRETDRRLRKVL